MSNGIPIEVPPLHGKPSPLGQKAPAKGDTCMTISTSSAQKTKKDLQKNAQNTKDNKKIQKDAAPTPKTGQSLALVLARPNMQPSVSSPVSNKRKHSPASTSPSLAATVFKLKSTATATTELLADFRNHRSAIKCIQCNNSSCVTATNIQQNEAIFTCTLCKLEVSQYVISTQISLLKKNKKTKTDTTDRTVTIVPALTGTNESLISEGDKLLLSNYHTIRHLLTCTTCNKIGTINKNGHNKSVPPRPIFICKCGKTYSTDQIRILMDAYELPETSQSSLPLVEDDEFEIEQIELDLGLDEDNLMQDSFVLPTLSTFSTSTDIPTAHNNNNNIINDLIQTINEMKQQLSRHDEQFVNFSGLMDQNKRLQREIIVQKREIDHLRKLTDQYKKEKERMIDSIQKSQNDSTEHQKNEKNNNQKEQKNDKIYLNQKHNISYTNTNTSIPSNSNSDSNEQYNIHFPAASVPQANPPPPVSYASKASTPKVHIKFTKKKMAQQTYRFNTPTPEQLEIASKAFDDSILTNPPDYQFVHFPCNRRLKPSELRQRLTLLGADNVRVIDAHCPDYNVAEFLVHENYVDELRSKFRSARVETLDYDYTDPVHLRDSRLASLSNEEKVQKLKEIRTNYLINRIKNIRYPVNYSVAKSLYRNGHITLEELKKTLKECRENKGVDGFTTTQSHNNNQQSGFDAPTPSSPLL